MMIPDTLGTIPTDTYDPDYGGISNFIKCIWTSLQSLAGTLNSIP
jgi:hypothetical protein